ncbi:ABC transporter ATP-binding protein [Corynebacterium aquatimens]|nr:ABC transporter ATP-binding protein [Corynebacterium aquatimens]WJY65332.1 Macrolide export ATP-binding/permease protein MacB [Corynebacterium aquatimens]
MSHHPLLRIENLEKTFGTGENSVRALDRVSLEIPRGQFVAIMGPSGSGKSTLLQCAAGLDSVDSGRVFLRGDELSAMSDDDLTLTRRERIGFIFQAFNLLPTMTARDNIALPLAMGRKKIDDAWFGHVVDMLGLRDRLSHRPAELSGGQQQRAAIARALITRPDIIFADEPTGALDQDTSETLLRFLRKCTDELGQTLIMVTHDPAVAQWSDRLIEFSDGRIVRDSDRQLVR